MLKNSNFIGIAVIALFAFLAWPTQPKEVKEAAERLKTKVADQTTSPLSDDPITDAEIITRYFLS